MIGNAASFTCCVNWRRWTTTPRRLAKRLRKYAAHVFAFLDHADVPLENNFAERQIRAAVILRNNSQSNRSDRGATPQAVPISVYHTLPLVGLAPTLQAPSSVAFSITDALKSYLNTSQLPPDTSLNHCAQLRS